MSDIVDDETLAIAVKKAIDVGLIPKVGFIDDVAENWEKVKAVTEIIAAEVSRRFEADLKRAHTVYDICREALEAEHHRASLAEMERDAILRWSIRHAGYLGTREISARGRIPTAKVDGEPGATRAGWWRTRPRRSSARRRDWNRNRQAGKTKNLEP